MEGDWTGYTVLSQLLLPIAFAALTGLGARLAWTFDILLKARAGPYKDANEKRDALTAILSVEQDSKDKPNEEKRAIGVERLQTLARAHGYKLKETAAITCLEARLLEYRTGRAEVLPATEGGEA